MLIKLGKYDAYIRCVELRTGAEQELGFQHVKTIPKHYALLFKGCGGSFFHMMNVPEPLLMLGLKEGKVICAEIRQPRTPGRRLSKGHQCDDVLELHPKYEPLFRPGSSLRFTDEGKLTVDKKSARVPNGIKKLLGSAYAD